MSDPENPNADAPEAQPVADAPDLSFIPETFKADDGSYKVDDFKAHFDGLAAFKAQADEAKAALPETPDGYAWALPEDFAFGEGFDPSAHKVPVLGEDGQPKIGADGKPETRDVTGADLLDANDPDLASLQAVLHEHGADPALMGKLASLMVNREVRSMAQAGEAAAAEKKALGPDAQSRIDNVSRSLAARMPAAQSNAILDSITSADALRGIEAMLKGSATPPAAANAGGFDNATASVDQRIAHGLRQREA